MIFGLRCQHPLRCVLAWLALMPLTQVAIGQQSGQASAVSPLAGRWHCTSTSMRIPASKNIPAGSMVQSTSYNADAQGRWVSNSILQYQADKGGERLRVHTTAGGVHSVVGDVVTEHVQRFQIAQSAAEPRSAFVRSAEPVFHAMLIQSLQRNTRQKYRLLQKSSNYYVMQPLTNSGNKTTQRIYCQKAG